MKHCSEDLALATSVLQAGEQLMSTEAEHRATCLARICTQSRPQRACLALLRPRRPADVTRAYAHAVHDSGYGDAQLWSRSATRASRSATRSVECATSRTC